MIETLLEHPLIDDFKALKVHDYIAMRKKHYPDKNEDFSQIESFQTIIMLSLSYPKEQVKFKGKGHGLLARYTYGKDYHKVFYELFDTLEKQFSSFGIKAKGYADVSPLDERFAAFLAGLGYIGKNQLLIHPNYGTYHFLGALLIDKAFNTVPYVEDSCGDCTLCIEACPPGALSTEGYNERLCTSYVTQMKIALNQDDRKPMKVMMFGCDICQRVCPKNKAITFTSRDLFLPDEASQLNLSELLTLSNKEIMRRYQNYAFTFRGGLVLKRNAIILLANQRQYDQLPLIKTVYEQYKHVPWFQETTQQIIEEMEKNA
ncbi:MAG: epoxyqueuosine reductase [Candidatus Izemoplasmataceae bacterium]